MEWLTDPQVWTGLLTLTVLEIVLGIDNVIFISILAGKLPGRQQARARTLGLGLAMISRIALLFSLAWIMRLTAPLFSVFELAVSGRDLILFGGGLFLIAKATHEIHQKLEGDEGHASARVPASFGSVIFQILLLDVVFSLDSVITAVGMVDRIGVMVAAVMIAVVVMIAFAGPVSAFVERHPTVKMLALSFLLLIGTSLVIESLHAHIPKGYIYFAMAFSVFVEMLNLRLKRKAPPVKLHEPYASAPAAKAAVAATRPAPVARP
jgi:predicted tellurium resistance membrane protein TerC